MKDTLEYNILKHLKENDSGDFIDMKGFIEDRKLLENKLRSLSKEPEKYISARFPFFIIGGGLPDFTDDQLQAKIEFNGIKYLNEIDKPETKSRLKKIVSNPWVIGISLVILAVILNAERIKKWVNSIIDGL